MWSVNTTDTRQTQRALNSLAHHFFVRSKIDPTVTLMQRFVKKESPARTRPGIGSPPNMSTYISHSFLFKCKIDGPSKGCVNVFLPFAL